MTVKRLTIEDIFKPNYEKKINRRTERRKQRSANKHRIKENRKRNWEQIRKISVEEFGE